MGRLDIQNSILEVVRQSDFFPVVYEALDKIVQLEDLESLQPASVAVNEVSASFSEGKNRQMLSQEKTSWRFELHLSFHREVLLENLEENLMNSQHRGGVRLMLVDAQYRHPPRYSETGTGVIYTLEARSARA